jgi:hypothetical protein
MSGLSKFRLVFSCVFYFLTKVRVAIEHSSESNAEIERTVIFPRAFEILGT